MTDINLNIHKRKLKIRKRFSIDSNDLKVIFKKLFTE